jgi:dihydropteroate synthase
VSRSDIVSVPLRFGGRVVAEDRALVMGIVNRTPLSDAGATYAEGVALEAVDKAVEDGADIVDIDGVQAGAGDVVDVAEEVRRVVPFVATVRSRHPDLVISVHTWRAEVGRLACAEGADLLNDSWAGADPRLAEVVAEFGVVVCCSPTGGAAPRTPPRRTYQADVVTEVLAELVKRAERMAELGVPEQRILIAPTYDLGKNSRYGLALLRRSDELVAAGWPVLMALADEDFMDDTLGVGLSQRGEGTLAATALAASTGVRVFRAPDVRGTRRTVEMVASIVGTRPPSGCVRALV